MADLYARQGVVLGKYQGRILRHGGTTHTLVVAPTRSGKTTSTAIPTLLDWRGSMFIFDPKMELYDQTAAWRSTFSTVVRLDPTSGSSGCCNLLDGIRLGTAHEIRDLGLLCEILGDPDGEPTMGGSAQHFREMSQDVNLGVALHGLYTGEVQTLRELDDYYSAEPHLETVLRAMEKTRHTRQGCHPVVRRTVQLLRRLADRELSGVQSTASRALRCFIDPLVARMSSTSDFTLRDLRERPGRPMSLYLTVPYSDAMRLRPLSRLYVRTVLLGYCTQHLGGWQHRMLALIDEFQSLNRLMALSEALNYAAGYGVSLILVTPSLHELVRLYGPNHNFLESCHVRMAYAPNDFEIARGFSHLTGEREEARWRESFSTDVHTFLGGRRTRSEDTRQRPLVSPTALMQLDKERVLLLVGNAPPALIRKAWYWRHWRWRRRAAWSAHSRKGGLCWLRRIRSWRTRLGTYCRIWKTRP